MKSYFLEIFFFEIDIEILQISQTNAGFKSKCEFGVPNPMTKRLLNLFKL